MPPAAKRRKIGATTIGSVPKPATQRGIQTFGKISKSNTQNSGKRIPGKESLLDAINSRSDLSIGVGRKRKIGPTDDNSDNEGNETAYNTGEQTLLPENDSNSAKAPTKIQSAQLLSCLDDKCITPRNRTILRSPPQETPTKGARLRLESLTLPASSRSTRSPPPTAALHETPLSCPASEPEAIATLDESTDLPDELQDLVNLHSSFLTALTLHYAHIGSMTPADLRNLCPGVERVWRKRRVTTEDVRRILELEQDDGQERAGPLYLSDYGSGKICVEIADSHHSQKAQRRPINEEALNTTFLKNLTQHWKSHRNSSQTDPNCPKTFIATLPLRPIIPCASISKLTPLLSKGQRRLEDLKAGAIKAQQKSLHTTTANSPSLPNQKPKPPTTRSFDLFSRLKAKQLHQTTLPALPSPALLARKSALQRLPEIAPVLESLALSSRKHANDDAVAEIFRSKVAHVSFTMPTLIQHLQMSLRNPIGKEEAGRCVKLLAEVAPEWLGVREVGRCVGVVVRGVGVGRGEMGRRVDDMLRRL
ncbi:hypothetical protein JMJ35_000488 [Cladonia borealis]|uniref:DNA replication factor Cdt1 C-terminal domain-containing protein n=1 Tax=Cladonia borealis TaxID=184061 RepID=A0AA39V5L4_9LECA|nr:hypothetical protein JMJ35_000488 [Cladonia borealis]